MGGASARTVDAGKTTGQAQNRDCSYASRFHANEHAKPAFSPPSGGRDSSPLIVAHRNDHLGRKSVRARLEIGTTILDPPDVARNAVFCTGDQVTRMTLGRFTEPELLEWIKSADEITPDSLKAYHAERKPER